MTAAQLMDILLKIPANKRKNYEIYLPDAKELTGVIVVRETKEVLLR